MKTQTCLLLSLLTATLLWPAIAPAAPVVLELGPHHRIVENVLEQVGEDGVITLQTNRYTELANGIGFWDGQSWQPTEEKFEVINGHAVATKGQLQVILAGNITESSRSDDLWLRCPWATKYHDRCPEWGHHLRI